MKKSIATLLVLAAATMTGSPALAQDATAPAAQPAAAPAKPWAPKWSSPELQKIGEMLIGSWKSGSVAQADSASARTELQMHIAPIVATDLTDTLYVEIARTDSGWRPYRQAMFQLYSYKGGVRLRTYEITSSPKISPVLTGLWLAPELLPELKRDDLIATIDIDLKPSADGYTGKSPYAYPTGAGGAVEMISEFTIGKNTLSSVDRGYDANGKIVWGSGENEKYTFSRFTPDTKLSRLEGGLIRIDYRESSNPIKIEAGDNVAAHYTGWLYSNGAVFDTSRDRNPLLFEHGKLIQGWNQGLTGLGTGSLCRLMIPAALGYGANGAGRVIPPNATLVFEIEVMDVQKRVPDPTPDAAGAQPAPTQPAQPAAAQPAATQPAAPAKQ